MLHVLDHPMIKHKLTTMRKIETGTKDFRQNLDEIASFMAYEITKDFPTRPVDIETPMGKCVGQELATEVGSSDPLPHHRPFQFSLPQRQFPAPADRC